MLIPQRTDLDDIALSAADKKLLKEIARHPHKECSREEIQVLRSSGLVDAETLGCTLSGMSIETGLYQVSALYPRYKEYLKEKRRTLFLKSLWIPLGVSVITNLIAIALQWLLPRIL